MMVRQNKWRAARYGLEAALVEANSYQLQPARRVVQHLVRLLRPVAEQLDCLPYLEHVLQMAEQPNWSERQLDLFQQTNDAAEVVRRMTCQSRLSEPLAVAAR
jgi:carboxylate-amine ligase